jgi:hypothetical protein
MARFLAILPCGLLVIRDFVNFLRSDGRRRGTLPYCGHSEPIRIPASEHVERGGGTAEPGGAYDRHRVRFVRPIMKWPDKALERL